MKNKPNRITNVNISSLSNYELSRWAALQEAIDIIAEKCDEKMVNFETVELKPLEILKYIDNASDTIFQRNFPSNKVETKVSTSDQINYCID